MDVRLQYINQFDIQYYLKIISKVLANGLKVTMHEVVEQNQCMLLRRKHIHDGCLLANEGVSEYKSMKNKVAVVKRT